MFNVGWDIALIVFWSFCISLSSQRLKAHSPKLTAQNYSAIIALTASITSSALGLEK